MTLPIETLNKILASHEAATARTLATAMPAIIVPDQFNVVNTEHLQEHRTRFRGDLETESLSDFCEYVIDAAEQIEIEGLAPHAFINAPQMSCRAILNIGNYSEPGHGDHTALLKLKPTAAFTAMRNIVADERSQRQLAEWMEDWHANLNVIDTTGQLMTVADAVQKVRNITIKASASRTTSESNFSASQSAMDKIEAAHEEKQPAEFVFSTAPYDELEEREFTLRLSILTGDSKPQLRLRWVQQEAQEEEIAQEFKELLINKLDDASHVTVGRFSLGK